MEILKEDNNYISLKDFERHKRWRNDEGYVLEECYIEDIYWKDSIFNYKVHCIWSKDKNNTQYSQMLRDISKLEIEVDWCKKHLEILSKK